MAAVSLALATQAQLGLQPMFNAAIALLFFSTLADYNLHRLLAVYNHSDATQTGKLDLAAGHTQLLKALVVVASAGLGISLFFVKTDVLIALLPLALLAFLYSAFTRSKIIRANLLLSIPGAKTFLLALVWASATVFIPALQGQLQLSKGQVLLLFIQRLIFIVAIAIPFDIRDMDTDSRAGIKTIPASFGTSRALGFSNLMLVISVVPALVQYLCSGMAFILPACLVSTALILFLINNKKIKNLPFYYHGILDGSIIVYGLIILLSFYLNV